MGCRDRHRSKGRHGQPALTFPDLSGEDFLPWINEDDARQAGVSAQEYAGQQAAIWKKGLADWGQSGDRVEKLRNAAEFVIYYPRQQTPGCRSRS